MPISVTCQCGSRLEIDEKFLGKEILCPDCQRPLPMNAPATPPPLELPSHQRTSGLAVMSLTFSLVGAFTIVGTIAGIVVGVVALRQISRQPKKFTGVGLARAGVILGTVFTFLTALAFIWPVLTLNVDEYLRWLAYASRTKALPDGVIKIEPTFINPHKVSIKCTPGWRQYTSPQTAGNQQTFTTDDLIAIHITENAFISCQNIGIDLDVNPDPKNQETAKAREEKALERFHKSELVNIVGRLGASAYGGPQGVVSERTVVPGTKQHEFYLDIRLGGHQHRFLIRWRVEKEVHLLVMAGGAPSSRFHRVESDIRKAFDTVEFK